MDSTALLRRRLTEWFPLVPRPRPACRALPERFEEIRQLADLADRGGDEGRLASAAEVLNKAALVASDCGFGDWAQQLCWRQFEVFDAHRPLDVRAAKLALQPLVNLGRLHIRSGRGLRAYQLFSGLYRAFREHTTATIEDRELHLNEFTDGTNGSRRELVLFLWTVLLADGTRALTRAGRWEDALTHVEQHNLLGNRLFDGRQVAIITHALHGRTDRALQLIEHSAISEAWEQSLGAYLTTLCTALENRASSTTAMAEHFLALAATRTPPMFRCRLGLCILDRAHHTDQKRIVSAIIQQALTSGDAYNAQDALAHPVAARQMTREDNRALLCIVRSSRPDCPNQMLEGLRTVVATAEASLAREIADTPTVA